MPQAALEVGAVAVKQYAWYHALKGNHRASYRSRGGECYDVRDDVRDQLFRPASARPTRKQLRAIDTTWGLSLRKNGRFFLTGYRAGSARRCAADADGWHLFARSVADCARDRGWSRKRIQQAYYRPNVGYVWADGSSGPQTSRPRVHLARWRSLRSAFAKVSWDRVGSSGGRRRPAVERYRLQHRVDGGSWQDVRLARRRATSTRVELKLGRVHRFRVSATDAKGERGPWASAGRIRAGLKVPRDRVLSGSRASLATRRGDRAGIRFKGHAVAYVAPLGPGMGSVKIRVDGKVRATVDLERAEHRDAKLVWTRNWSRSRERKVVVKALHTGEIVRIDGFLLLS
jgi:hypothetical protein